MLKIYALCQLPLQLRNICNKAGNDESKQGTDFGKLDLIFMFIMFLEKYVEEGIDQLSSISQSLKSV